MRSNLQLAAVLAALAAATGCAYSQSVRLPVSPQRDAILSLVVIEDLRPAKEKETYVMGGKCVRAYGDQFIEPNKVEYLRRLLAERLAPREKLVVKLERFDTIERCEGLAGKVGSGDDFTLTLVGSANGVPFRYRRAFDFSDLRFVEFPSESARYRARMGQLFGEFARLLRDPEPQPQPGHDPSPRAVGSARGETASSDGDGS